MATDWPDETFDAAPRVVRPRSKRIRRLPVIAIHDGQTLNEDGELGELADLIFSLHDLQPTLFIKYNSADFLADLDAQYGKLYESWQWRATEQERTIVMPDGRRAGSRVTTIIHFFGFKHGNYHKILDPVTLYAKGFQTKHDNPLAGLLELAVNVRDFCDENNIEVRPTVGAMGAQFLTDPRFYPQPRRKVSSKTNEAMREQLPGNYYHLSVKPGPKRDYTAYYLDQRRAHHYHARQITFPHSNNLYAIGRFQDCAECVFPETWPEFSGLYCLDLEIPQNRRTSQYARRWLKHGLRDTLIESRFIYSNEIPFLLDAGYKVHGVRAAWGSHIADKGLRTYAEWADTQLDRYDDADWVKPLLLSTYGTLATRPKVAETMFASASRGEPVTIVVGNYNLNGMLVKSGRKIEPRYANVLQRGMIDAATRIESISYADYLTSRNYHVLCIYADAVMVNLDEDKEPPLLVEPWRLKETLNHLEFINTQAFQSDQMTKLPGVSGISKDSARHRQSTNRAPRHMKKYDMFGKPTMVPIGGK